MADSVKHILILSSWYPTRLHPFLGNFVQQQAKLLATKYSITVLHTIADKDVKKLEIVTKKTGHLTEIVIYHPKGNNFISKHREQYKAFDHGLKLLKNIDLIHAHIVYPKGYLFVRAKKKLNCPLILTEHASIYRKDYINKWNYKERYIFRTTRKAIDRLISVSDFLSKDMKTVFDKEKIITISNPVDTEHFISDKSKRGYTPQFLHVSTLDERFKNPKGIIDAVALLKEKNYTKFNLTIVSDESFEHLKQYASEKKIEEFISFIGPLSQQELLDFYQRSDAFVLFSKYETFSIVLAEAWSCGLPVISTSVGIADHMDGKLGIQIKQNDTLGLAIGMERILQGEKFDSDYIRNHALQFSNEVVLKKLEDVYNSLNG